MDAKKYPGKWIGDGYGLNLQYRIGQYGRIDQIVDKEEEI
jgi:hypothetical protein